MDLSTILMLVCAAITAASGFCAATPTPDPSTVWGRIYWVIECLALIVNRAKDSGYLPNPPAGTKSNGIDRSVGGAGSHIQS